MVSVTMRVHDTVTGNIVAQYTYANGYMIVAPSAPC
jgi:hypothetical protein